MASGGLAPCRRCENRPRYQRGRGKHIEKRGGKRGKFSERFVQELGTLDVSFFVFLFLGDSGKIAGPPPKKTRFARKK